MDKINYKEIVENNEIEEVIKEMVKELTTEYPKTINGVTFDELCELKSRMSILDFKEVSLEKNKKYIFIVDGKQDNNVFYSNDDRIDLMEFTEFGSAVAKLPGAASKLEKGIIYTGVAALTLSFCILAYYFIFI